DRDRCGHAPSGRRDPDTRRGQDVRARTKPRRRGHGPVRDQGRRRVDRPRHAEDLAYRCSSIRGMYFSTACFAFNGSFPRPRRITRSALRPPWTTRYWLALARLTPLSRASILSQVTASATP